MDREGNLVIGFRFYYSSEFSEGRAEVYLKRDDKLAYINESGEVVIAPQYDEGRSFYEGLAQVRINGLVGFIDRQGNQIVTPRFAMGENFRGGLAAVKFKLAGANSRQWGYIDTTGRVVIPPRFDVANSFSEGLAAVVVNGQIGYIDAKGNWAIAPRFQRMASLTYDLSLPNFSEGLAVMKAGDRYGYIDKEGNVVVEPYFEMAQSFSQGLAAVQIAKNVSYINKGGGIAIKPQFDSAREFSEGMAAVNVGEKWGFIDQTGTIVIKPQFDVVMPFKGGLSRVWKGIESNYINKDGVYVVPGKSGAVAAQGVPQSLSIIPKEQGLGTSEQLTRKTLAVFDFKLDKRGANFVHSEKSSNDSVIPQDRPEAIKVPFSKCQGEDYFALAGLPAEIGYAPVGGGCTIENHSTKRIVRYRLGCVTQLNGELNILRSDDETHVNLPPADLIAGRFPLEILNLRQIDKTCKTAGRKLAIVELTFADGVMWDLAALNQMNR